MVAEGTERELVQACQRGERDAFRALFEQYRNKVYSIALRFSGDDATAMDIAQDTFLKLFSCIRDFRGDSSFDTWIYRLVVNSCMDHRRRAWRVLPLADRFRQTLRIPGDSLTELLRSERGGRVRAEVERLTPDLRMVKGGRVRAEVERLTPDLRMVIVLRYTEGLSYEQIAEVLGCSLGTVASRLNRAHKRLEQRLSRVAQENGGFHV